MIAFLILLFVIAGIIYLVVPIVKGIFLYTLILCAIISIILIIKSIFENKHNNKIQRIINTLTLKEVFNTLSLDEKKQVARYVDCIVNNQSSKPTIGNDLRYVALGYTASTLGFDRIVRYGFGYVILRDFLKSLQKKRTQRNSTK